MSFDEKFMPRWTSVIEPAIRAVGRNDHRLEPNRVDARTNSDSILTEILGGITNDRLIFADVTTIDKIDQRAIRNANVMYEIGMAHAVRLPEEVIIFRSDEDELLFDILNVRVNRYSPECDQAAARELVSEAIINALKEIDLKRNLAVKAAAESLDATAHWALTVAVYQGELRDWPTKTTIAQALSSAPPNQAIRRLLEMGALRMQFLKLQASVIENLSEASEETLGKYKATEFGRAILEYCWREMRFIAPDVQHALEATFGANAKTSNVHVDVSSHGSPSAGDPS